MKRLGRWATGRTDRLKTTFHKPAGFAPHHPAPGYRHRDTGALVNVGRYGYSWSSAVSGNNGVFLNFGTQHLSTSYSDYRAHGFQLRCLSE
ncbi:hypothetical protein [uncultured Rikenella sp.]|uniref:hypothetical protein n=1 Tax=uncultured Rikenella sp. TaxID=368003 RepID=UPI0025FC6246|nr:hypothetical protein [uncultured Rikenella sp.]